MNKSAKFDKKSKRFKFNPFMNMNFSHTKWMLAWQRARQRCIKPKHPDYKYYGARGIKFYLTKEEVKGLWLKDKVYLMKQPSLDRIDNDGNYTYLNCQFIEMVDNRKKSNFFINNPPKPILQYDLQNNFIKEYKSIIEASKEIGVHSSSIIDNLKGRTRNCKNFIWKYKEK